MLWNWLQEYWRAWRKPLTLGQRGERLAEKFLRRQGYVIVARGSRSKYGELDLVAVVNRFVVFVEVKTRASHIAGHPAEAVDLHKQRRITRAARAFVHQHQLEACSTRFDVIAITWSERNPPEIQHFRHAFTATD